MRHPFNANGDHERGNFRVANDDFLTLFNGPGGRGPRSWRETFGYECAARRPRPKQRPIKVPATPKSSSDL